jgi:hypothetical protein
MKDNNILNNAVAELITILYSQGYDTDTIIEVLVKIGFTKKVAKEYIG